RDDPGNPLMFGATMTYATAKDAQGNAIPVATNGAVELQFSKPTSRAYIQELLEREFRTALRVPVTGETFTLTGVGEPVEGRFAKMKLDVSKNEAFSQLVAAKSDPAQLQSQLGLLGLVLEGTRRSFDAAPEPERLEVFD